jgi:hypothetical protein
MTVNLFSIELLYSSHGSLRSSFSVLVIFVSIAYEGKSTLVILNNLDGEDMSILFKEFFKFIIRVCRWEVLDIDVVECFSKISSVLWLVSLNIEW